MNELTNFFDFARAVWPACLLFSMCLVALFFFVAGLLWIGREAVRRAVPGLVMLLACGVAAWWALSEFVLEGVRRGFVDLATACSSMLRAAERKS